MVYAYQAKVVCVDVEVVCILARVICIASVHTSYSTRFQCMSATVRESRFPISPI
jgi:hypothetical protein